MAWLARCVACELRVLNVLVIILGFAMQGVGFIMLIADPLTDVEGFGDLVDTYKIKVAPFALGMALMLAGIIGLKFVKTRRAGASVPYFTFLVIVLIAECIGLYLTMSIVHTLQVAGTPEKARLATSTDRDVISKVFYSFQKRFAFDPDKIQDLKTTERNCKLEPSEPVPDGGYAECKDVTVACSAYEKVEHMMKKWCVPKNDDMKAEFKSGCDSCLHGKDGVNFYTLWINGSKYSQRLDPVMVDGKPADLILWRSETSLGFCRCYGRIIGSLERHTSQVCYGIVFFICLQLSVIGCSGYLLCCTSKKDSGDDYDDYETELM